MNDYNAIIKKSYLNFLLDGPRSSNKLKPLHGGFGNILLGKRKWDLHHFVSEDGGKEFKIKGKYTDKNLDGYFKKDDKEICISLKFVTSNLGQNENNYLENLMGDVANIKSLNKSFGKGQKTFFVHLQVIRESTPYFSKAKEVVLDIPSVSKVEKIDWSFFNKINTLSSDSALSHAPDFTGVFLVKIHNKGYDKKKIELLQQFLNSYALVRENKSETKTLIESTAKKLGLEKASYQTLYRLHQSLLMESLPETNETVKAIIREYRLSLTTDLGKNQENRRKYLKQLDNLIEVSLTKNPSNSQSSLFKNEQVNDLMDRLALLTGE